MVTKKEIKTMANLFKFLNTRGKIKNQNKGDLKEPLLGYVNEKEKDPDTREINQIAKVKLYHF